MITTPEENIALTEEQNKQIDEVALRLAKLQVEIVTGSRLLNSLRNDGNRLLKENTYQQEVLDETIKHVKEAEAKFAELNETNSQLALSSANIHQATKERSAILEEKEMASKKREDDVAARELNVSKLEGALARSVTAHTNDKEDFNQKAAKLREVLKNLNV